MLGVQWPLISSTSTVIDDHRSNDTCYDEHTGTINTPDAANNEIYHHQYTASISTDDVLDTSHDISIQSDVLDTPVDHLMPVQMMNDHDINDVFTAGASSATAITLSVTMGDHYNEHHDSGIMESGGVDSLDFPNVCAKLQSSPAIYLSAKFCERPFLEHTSTLADILTASLASKRSSTNSAVTRKTSIDESNTTLLYSNNNSNQDLPNDEDCLAPEPTAYPNQHPQHHNRRRRRSVVLEHLEILTRPTNRHLADAMPVSNRRRMSLSQDHAAFRPSAVMDLPTSFNARRRLSLPMASLNNSGQELALPLTTPWSILKESENYPLCPSLPEAIIPLVPSSLVHTSGTISSANTSLDINIDSNKQHLDQTHACHDISSTDTDSLLPPLTPRVNWQLDIVLLPMTAPIGHGAENEQISDYESNGTLPGQRTLSYGKDVSRTVDTSTTTEVSDNRTRRNRSTRRHRRRRATIPPRQSADVPPLNLLEWQGLPPPITDHSSSSMVPINRTEHNVLTAAIPTPTPWLRRHLDEQVPLTALSSSSNTPTNTNWSNTEEKKSTKETDLDQKIATSLYSVTDQQQHKQRHQSTESLIDCGSSNISNDGSYDSQQGPECDWSTSTSSSVDSQESARTSGSNDSQQSRLSTFSWGSWRLGRDTTATIVVNPLIRQRPHGLADLLPSPYSAPSIASTASSSPHSLLSSASNTLRKRPSLARITSSVIGMGKQLSLDTFIDVVVLNLPTTVAATVALSSIQHLPPKHVQQGEIVHSLKSRASTLSVSSKWHRLSSGDKMIRIDALDQGEDANGKEDDENEEGRDTLTDLNQLSSVHRTRTTGHDSSSTTMNTTDMMMNGNIESNTYHSRSSRQRRGSAQILLSSDTHLPYASCR
ncbi:hypothetical protein BDF22DRAFT_741254 [Syncephalis plumigaleata]|nr:hypothetical protein BDF22DRAFT_741254 [Syncephalis plumigaleata]